MKRTICIILSLLFVFSLAACGSDKGELDYLVLVNKENLLPEGWEQNLETTEITNSLGNKVKVEKNAGDAFLKLKSALEKEDVRIDLYSALRSASEQEELVKTYTEKNGEDYVKRNVASPGYSEHQTGLALDLYLNIDGNDVYDNEEMAKYPEVWKKVHKKLSAYGFILRYPEGKQTITGYDYKPWHIRFVDSKKNAEMIGEDNKTLEEFLSRLPKSEVYPKPGMKETQPSVTVKIEGEGQITYAKLGEQLRYGDKVVTRSIEFIAWETSNYTFGAKPAKGYKFVKWTCNGKDYSTDEEINVNLTEDCDFIAHFIQE